MTEELDGQSPRDPSMLLDMIKETLAMDPSLFEVEETRDGRVLSGTVPSERDRSRLERFMYDQLSLHDLRLDVAVDEMLQGDIARTGGDPNDPDSSTRPSAEDLI